MYLLAQEAGGVAVTYELGVYLAIQPHQRVDIAPLHPAQPIEVPLRPPQQSGHRVPRDGRRQDLHRSAAPQASPERPARHARARC